MGKTTMKPDFISWTDDDLTAHKKALDKSITTMELEITELKSKLEQRKEQVKIDKDVQLILNREMENRNILSFEDRMRKKYGKGFSDKRWGKVFRKAWDDGHSYGENEVENYLIDLVDLFED